MLHLGLTVGVAMSEIGGGGLGLPSVSWMTEVTGLLDQYRIVALLVLCLAIAITLWRGRNKDFGFWLCWTIVGLCAFTIIGGEVEKELNNGEIGGGIINLVPNKMFLYSNEKDNFFDARLRKVTFADRNDYEWIRLNNGSEEQFRHVDFILDQNKKKITRDTNSANLAVVGDNIEPAPVRFNIVVPSEELGALRSRTLSLELHTPSGSLPYFKDGEHKVLGKIVDPDDTDDALTTGEGAEKARQKTGFLLIPSAYAQQAVNPEDALRSTRADTRSEGLQALQQQFDSKLHWMNKVLEDPRSSTDLRLAIVSSIRNHFKDDSTIDYPHPKQFEFISPASYTRMILDGLDTTTALGVNARLLINNTRDERVDQSFDLVFQKVFAGSDNAHKSCLALFYISVQYNWAFLISQLRPATEPPLTPQVLNAALDILNRAQQRVALLSGDDVVQAARLDYIKGVIFGTIATASSPVAGPGFDRNELLEGSKKAFQKFLSEISDNQHDNYRYPAHFDVARAFLANPSAAALEPSTTFANPERGCSDPGEAS